jgi:DNA-binding beta-propeller fold protein YncE
MGVGRTLAHDPLDPGTRIRKPGHVVHSHDGARAYRANGTRRGIGVLDPRTLRVLREIATGERVDLVALSEDGRWLYGVSLQADHIVVVETATERIVGRLPLLLPRPPQ